MKDLEQQVKGAEAGLDQSASQINQAEFAIKSADAQLVKAQADFVRASKLIKKGDISKRMYDDTKATCDIRQRTWENKPCMKISRFPLDTAPPRMRCGNMAAMTVVCTIVLSIVAHGLSANPLVAALAVNNAVLRTMGKAVILISHVADRNTLSPALSLL